MHLDFDPSTHQPVDPSTPVDPDSEALRFLGGLINQDPSVAPAGTVGTLARRTRGRREQGHRHWNIRVSEPLWTPKFFTIRSGNWMMMMMMMMMMTMMDVILMLSKL